MPLDLTSLACCIINSTPPIVSSHNPLVASSPTFESAQEAVDRAEEVPILEVKLKETGIPLRKRESLDYVSPDFERNRLQDRLWRSFPILDVLSHVCLKLL